MGITGKPGMIRDRQSALEFLYGRIDYERTRTVPYRSRRFKLDRMRKLAGLVDHPERDFPAIHIAGTKGKGSTACMVASALSAAGYRTGLYTSPHLHQLEERFVVDGQQCSAAELVGLLSELEGPVRWLDKARGMKEGPTYFEITTAAALLHFRHQRVDCAVLEVGLGGRLDSTNICRPALCVITSISLDHTRQLGSSLALIAGEKAGIIKPGVPVVTGVDHPEPFGVIAEVAQRAASPLVAVGRDFGCTYWGTTPEGVAGGLAGGGMLDYWDCLGGERRALNQVRIAMRGQHQASNAAVALASLSRLRQEGWTLSEEALRGGLASARCPARFEVLSQHPAIIVDAAHNPASVHALCQTLVEQFPGRPRLLVFAASTDKDVAQMLDQLLVHFDQVILTRYQSNPRAMEGAELARLTRDILQQRGRADVGVEVCETPAAAWQLACSWATPAHVVCIAGSFFLAAEMRSCLNAASQDAAGANSPCK